MHKIDGFTLIEVLMTIVIVSILAILPFFSMPATSINLDGQAQQLAHDIRYTQSLSMTKSQRYRLQLNTGTNSYQIVNGAGTAVLLASGSTTVTLNTGISFATLTNLPNNMIVFDGDGVPYTDTSIPGTALSANASITLQSSGSSKTVVITPLTGKVNVQ